MKAPETAAAKPAVSAPTTSKRVDSSTAVPQGVSILGIGKAVEKEDTVQTEKKEKRNYKFDESSLRLAWYAYADKIPEKLVLSQTIKNASMLTITAENEITVTVSNSYQQTDLQNEQHEILAFLCDELRNDFLKMKIVVDATVKIGDNKTDAEVFNEQKKSNEILKFLSQEFELEI